MRIGGREIGPGREPYVIAELGVNHDGSPERALALVDAAADAGADAVKLQCFEADRLMSRASRLAAYQRAAGERDPVEMLRRLELPPAAMARVVERAHARGVRAIVTVFSADLVAGADALGWDAYKTASPDIVHLPLLEALSATGRPLLVSTGAATAAEVERAARWLRELGAGARSAALQCVSSYPARDEDAALGAVPAVARLTGLPAGYSDHTTREDTGAFAVALGACVLEKHLTYDRAAAGPDHAASLEPAGFARYAALARRAARGDAPEAPAAMIGPAEKRVLDCERDVRSVSRQSVVAARALRAGEVVAASDLTVKRPGTGLEPWRLREAVGRRAARDVEADTPLVEADLL